MTTGGAAPAPRIRVVVVNYNGGDHLLRCFEHLARTTWPDEALDLVLVDNASSDGSADQIEKAFPQVRVMRSPENLGWSGGNNLGLEDLDDVQYVALVNPDAFVEAGWLGPLVQALQSDPRVGAANPKVLLEPRFLRLALTTDTFSPGIGDPRRLGVRVSGVRHNGRDRWTATRFTSGFFDVESDRDVPHFHWSEGEAELSLPLDRDEVPTTDFELRLDAERAKTASFDSGGSTTACPIDTVPAWYTVRAGGEALDLINSAGNEMVDGAYGADRGYGLPARDCLTTSAEVFSWTGSIVLLGRSYLDDVGAFDGRLFIYSDDLDHAWRGRLRGWKHVYVADIGGRHVQGGVVSRESPLAEFYTHRNALLTLVKNAPASVARRELARYLRNIVRMARAEIWLPLRRRHRPQPHFTRRRIRVVGSYLRLVPHALRQRRRIRRGATVSRESVIEEWG